MSPWWLSWYDVRSSAHRLLRNVSTRRLIRALEREGFQFTERQGSQRIYRHPDSRRVVIPYHRANDTLPPYAIRNLLIGTRWTEDDLRRLG
jgi:predicted RNA binding protein YcfA (HicA-like mRNA interferase family)